MTSYTRASQGEARTAKYEARAAANARLYAKEQQAVRVREQILAVVSHDLKNPLQTILMSGWALDRAAAAEKRDPHSAVARIQRAAQRMLRLIDDLLDFASIEAGSLALRRKPQDPGSMLQETLESFEIAARENQVLLAVEKSAELPKLYCDRDRVLQVLSNLVGNATKVVAKGGHITLRVEDEGPEILFSVADDGPGISKADVEHLFKRYWRSGEVEYKGTGLGLAIARGIVTAHGGRLWVASELGHGATFFFTIPASDDRRRLLRRTHACAGLAAPLAGSPEQ